MALAAAHVANHSRRSQLASAIERIVAERRFIRHRRNAASSLTHRTISDYIWRAGNGRPMLWFTSLRDADLSAAAMHMQQMEETAPSVTPGMDLLAGAH